MIRTATPRPAASLSAPPTMPAVSGPRWKSYCATSSERCAGARYSASSRARSSGCWPPSVRVRIRMDEFIEQLRRARIGATFNFYRDGAAGEVRRARLLAYLRSREEASLLLVGEAPGYRGARVSGIPFTSERQLTGTGPAEATATIVHRVLAELEIEKDVLLWNVVPTHPGTETSNRRPTRSEVEAGLPFLAELARGRRSIAVGRLAHSVVGGPYVRHPSHGGGAEFRLMVECVGANASSRPERASSVASAARRRSACRAEYGSNKERPSCEGRSKSLDPAS